MSVKSLWWGEQRKEKATEAYRERSALTTISLIIMLEKKEKKKNPTSLNLCFTSIAAGSAEQKSSKKKSLSFKAVGALLDCTVATSGGAGGKVKQW